MFFCRECEKSKNWPNSISKSWGKCEVCGNTAACSDIPSRYLPVPVPTPKPEYVGKHRQP